MVPTRLVRFTGFLLISTMALLAACAEAPERDRAAGSDSVTGRVPSSGPSADTASAARDGIAAGDSTSETAGDSAAAQAPTAADTAGRANGGDVPAGRRYNVRSGVIELRSSFMGDLRQTIYFDDFGAKEAVYANANIGGTVTRSVMVMADGANVVYDPVRKSGTRIDMADALTKLGLGGIPNLSSLSATEKRELKYQPIAGRSVLGRTTEGAAIEIMGTPVKVWTWQGIPLRMEASMQGNAMTVEATSLKTDIPVPADRFKIPSDVKITVVDAK